MFGGMATINARLFRAVFIFSAIILFTLASPLGTPRIAAQGMDVIVVVPCIHNLTQW
jgi:hypothetical protein